MSVLSEITSEVDELLSEREGLEIGFETTLEETPDRDKAEEKLTRNTDKLQRQLEKAESKFECDIDLTGGEREELKELIENLEEIIH